MTIIGCSEASVVTDFDMLSNTDFWCAEVQWLSSSEVGECGNLGSQTGDLGSQYDNVFTIQCHCNATNQVTCCRSLVAMLF